MTIRIKDLLAGQATCPNCGHVYNPTPWARRQTQAFNIGPSVPSGSVYEKVKPAAKADIQADVVVPLLQATATTVVAFGVSLAGLVALEADVRWSLVVAVGTMGYSWLTLLGEHRENLTEVETVYTEPTQNVRHASRPIILRTPPNTRLVASEVDSILGSDSPVVTSIEHQDPNEVLKRDLSEFVSRGKLVGYNIKAWKGRYTANGTRVSDPMWRQWTDWLREAGIMEKDRGGTRLAPGVTVRVALECICRE